MGLFILWILLAIPFVGALVKMLAVIFGIGATAICIVSYYNEKKKEKKKVVVKK